MFNSDEFRRLLIERLLGSLTPEEEAYVERELESSGEARQLEAEINRVLGLDSVRSHREHRDEDKLLATILSSARENPANKHWHRLTMLVAAAVTVAFITAGLLYYLRKKETVPSPFAVLIAADGQVLTLADSTVLIEAKIGKAVVNYHSDTLRFSSANDEQLTLKMPAAARRKVVLLSDGTIVHVNSRTTFHFPVFLAGGRRKVTIDGEAFVRVRQSHGIPFVVETPAATITVLGTLFNVNTYERGSIRVALVGGSVRLDSRNRSSVIRTGEEAVLGKTGSFEIRSFDVDSTTAWIDGGLEFDDAPLPVLLQKVGAWYDVKIIIDNPSVTKKRVTCIVDKSRPITNLLEGLKRMNMGFKTYYFEGDSIIHLK